MQAIPEMTLEEIVSRFGVERCRSVLRAHFSKAQEKELAALKKAGVTDAQTAAVGSQWMPGDGPEFLKAWRRVKRASKSDRAAVAAKLEIKS